MTDGSMGETLLVRHDDKKAFTSVLVRLQLVVPGVNARPTAQKYQEL